MDSNHHTIANATLQGLAAGTILYVTFFEVLDRERKKDTAPGLLKLLFTVIGFFFMVILELYGIHTGMYVWQSIYCYLYNIINEKLKSVSITGGHQHGLDSQKQENCSMHTFHVHN